MHRLNLDLIALPHVVPQQVKIAHKVPPRMIELTELRRILNERVAQRDTPVTCRERDQSLKGPG